MNYKGYEIEIENRNVMIDGKPAPMKSRVVFVFGNEELRAKLHAARAERRNLPDAEIEAMGGESWNSTADFLRDALKIDPHTVAYMIDGMDKRTRAYLSAIEKRIGLVGVEFSEEGVELKREYTLPSPWGNVDQIECGKDADGAWWAQFGYRADIDSVLVESYKFNRKPTGNMVETARAVNETRNGFNAERLSPEFGCWECGATRHWLDIAGEDLSLEKRVGLLEEKYCGC